jgi:hypothetical protein
VARIERVEQTEEVAAAETGERVAKEDREKS